MQFVVGKSAMAYSSSCQVGFKTVVDTYDVLPSLVSSACQCVAAPVTDAIAVLLPAPFGARLGLVSVLYVVSSIVPGVDGSTFTCKAFALPTMSEMLACNDFSSELRLDFSKITS